jgi:hypothetical protein
MAGAPIGCEPSYPGRRYPGGSEGLSMKEDQLIDGDRQFRFAPLNAFVRLPQLGFFRSSRREDPSLARRPLAYRFIAKRIHWAKRGKAASS